MSLFQISIHSETGGSTTDADGTGHDDACSFDIDTGNTAIDQNLNLGDMIGQASDATTSGMSDGVLDPIG